MNRTVGLKPISDKRRAELAAAGVNPSTTFDKPAKPARQRAAKRPRDTGPDQAHVNGALERDGYSCTVCGGALHGRRGIDWSVHHRKLRSQGGDNRLSNLISVCGHGTAGCHGDIHSGPEKACEAGWMLLATDDPQAVPVEHSQHGRVFLLDDGGWTKRRPNTNDETEESCMTRNEQRKLTYSELAAEATERFGNDPMQWAFRCPACGDVATPHDFSVAAGDPGRAGQECIGRTLRRDDPSAERGCDWVAYGLIPGPWEITYPAEGNQPERTLRAFPLAEAAAGDGPGARAG